MELSMIRTEYDDMEILESKIAKYSVKAKTKYAAYFSKFHFSTIIKAAVNVILKDPCSLYFIVDFIISAKDIIPEYSPNGLLEILEQQKNWASILLTQQLCSQHAINIEAFIPDQMINKSPFFGYSHSNPPRKNTLNAINAHKNKHENSQSSALSITHLLMMEKLIQKENSYHMTCNQ